MTNYNKLTIEEFNVINIISNKAKMDWVYIETDNNDKDFIYDTEEDKLLTLKQGILMMNEGLTDIADYGLTTEEQNTYSNLILKLEEAQ